MSRRSTTAARSGSTVDMEVSNLFKLRNRNDFTNALLSLRQKYKDEDLVNKIQSIFVQRHSAIVKGAKKFADAVRTRYANSNIPYHQLLLKARAHGKKYSLSEAEFGEFQRIFEQELAGTSRADEVVVPITNLMKVLGNITGATDNYFNVGEADFRNLQEIIKLHDMSKPLHAQVLLQSLLYKDEVSALLRQATWNAPVNGSPMDCVHPVMVALFAPKLALLEQHFLFSNMSGIVKSRYNREPITTRADYELFYNLVTDPNDVICDSRTPVGDLLQRCNLQNQLWNMVLHMRNGQFYNASFREFMTAIDICRLNKHDNPDLIYARHDGTILKRLLSAFSFRPTTVALFPVVSLYSNNPYYQNVKATVTAIPMINVRLMNYSMATGLGGAPASLPTGGLDLQTTFSQPQTFIENNTIVQRQTQVMYSRDVLIFYVDRRANIMQLTGQPFNMARGPTGVAGFERINNLPIDFKSEIYINGTKTDDGFIAGNGTTFRIRSVVYVTTPSDDVKLPEVAGTKYVTGSETLVWYYDENGDDKKSTNINTIANYKPIATKDQYKPLNDAIILSASESKLNEDLLSLVKTQGIIFVYENCDLKDDITGFSY